MTERHKLILKFVALTDHYRLNKKEQISKTHFPHRVTDEMTEIRQSVLLSRFATLSNQSMAINKIGSTIKLLIWTSFIRQLVIQ